MTTGSFPHDNFSSVYWLFTKLDHMISRWKGKNPISFGVIRSKVKVTYYKYNFWQQGRFRTITLVLYIGSLTNVATWFPCGRGRTLFILGSLDQKSRSALLYIELLTTGSFTHDNFSSVYWIFITWFPCRRGRTLFILGSLPLYRLIIYIDVRILWCTHFLFYLYISIHAYKSTSNDTKGFYWKELPSWKCEILHVIFTTMHKNN